MVGVRSSAIQGSQWDERTKELAYEVYSRRCDGDMVCTFGALADLDIPNIPEKTVYDWRSRYRWRERLQAEKQAIAPIQWEMWFRGVSVAALDALADLHRTIQCPATSDRDRIAADKAILQLFSQHIELIGEWLGSERTPVPDSLDSLTDAELLDYQAQLQNG